MSDSTKLYKFTRGYIIAAFWSSNEDDGTPMDAKYSIDDISPVSLAIIKADCETFWRANAGLLAKAGNDSQNGHDYWLTRNGHGTGFWDRGYPDAVGDRLTEICRVAGEKYLCVGDDGQIHID